MRLIDADALLEKVQFRLPIDNYNAEVISGCVNITRRLIENAPTIDAVPVVGVKTASIGAETPVLQTAQTGIVSAMILKQTDRTSVPTENGEGGGDNR